jgi:hypothetical protein
LLEGEKKEYYPIRCGNDLMMHDTMQQSEDG